MAYSTNEILKSFPDLLKLEAGNPETQISGGPCPQEAPRAGAIAYVAKTEALESVMASDVAAVVVDARMAEAAKALAGDKVLISSKNLRLAMTKVNQQFFPVEYLRKPFAGEQVHSTAVIHPEASLDPSVVVGPNTVIHENVNIGAGTFIGANSVIEANVVIGKDCFLHHMVYVGHSTRIGDRCEVMPNTTVASDGFGYAQDEKGNSHHMPHYGEVILEDDVSLGANVNVDRGTFGSSIIGRGTKVDNHCHFAHNVEVGENNLITAGFIVAGSSKIGDRCIFAGRASVNGHINMGSDITIGPLSAVTGDLPGPGAFSGFPVIPAKEHMKVQASLAGLPRIRKNVAKLMKKMGIE
jgi:UDP-3-O-[3-hydroxymyristoyl] glucosamine N-acyltransferase